MRKVALALLFLAASIISAYAQPDLGKPYRVETFSAKDASRLEVQTSGGHIHVGKGDDDQFTVEMYVRKNGKSYDEGEVELDDYTISIQKMGNTVQAIAKRNGGFSYMSWDDNYSIHFVVYTPKEINAELKTSGGHISLMGLEGDIDAKTSGGHIACEDVSGNVKVSTSGGHIELTYFEGLLDASTSGGHIDISNASGDLTFKTSGGHIKLNKVSGTINGKTSGGNITATITGLNKGCELKTSGGNITVQLPANEGFDIDAKGSRVTSRLTDFSGSTERDEVNGTVRGGGSKVYLKTSGGSITLTQLD
ncbi:hypothetical protein EP331_07405 [bacterium]|nr:MAG: hypothetical protein EP331_07405 [bacterium]